MLFWVLWAVTVIVALITLYFFIAGLRASTVSSFNIVLWLGLLATVATIVGSSWWLKHNGHDGWAMTLVGALAIPALFAGLLMLITLISKPRWN